MSDKTKEELLEEARERDIEGRSSMNKAELEEALSESPDEAAAEGEGAPAPLTADDTNPDPDAEAEFTTPDNPDAEPFEPPVAEPYRTVWADTKERADYRGEVVAEAAEEAPETPEQEIADERGEDVAEAEDEAIEPESPVVDGDEIDDGRTTGLSDPQVVDDGES